MSTTSTRRSRSTPSSSTPQPAKLKQGYANFAIAEPPLKLVLLENPGQGGSINHLGVEVESSETVHAEIARLTGRGPLHRRRNRHHLLLRHPGQGLGHRTRRREVGGLHRARRFRHFGNSPQHLDPQGEGALCCGTSASADNRESAAVILLLTRSVGESARVRAQTTTVARRALHVHHVFACDLIRRPPISTCVEIRVVNDRRIRMRDQPTRARTTDGPGRSRVGRQTQGAVRSGPAEAPQRYRQPLRRRSMCVRPLPGYRPDPADDLSPFEGASHCGAAGCLSVAVPGSTTASSVMCCNSFHSCLTPAR